MKSSFFKLLIGLFAGGALGALACLIDNTFRVFEGSFPVAGMALGVMAGGIGTGLPARTQETMNLYRPETHERLANQRPSDPMR